MVVTQGLEAWVARNTCDTWVLGPTAVCWAGNPFGDPRLFRKRGPNSNGDDHGRLILQMERAAKTRAVKTACQEFLCVMSNAVKPREANYRRLIDMEHDTMECETQIRALCALNQLPCSIMFSAITTPATPLTHRALSSPSTANGCDILAVNAPYTLLQPF